MKQKEPKCKKYGKWKESIPIKIIEDPYYFNNTGNSYPELAKYYITKRPKNEKSKQVLKNLQEFIDDMKYKFFRINLNNQNLTDKQINKKNKKICRNKTRFEPKINERKKRKSKWIKKIIK